jgi:hypothetical protein
MLTQKHSTLMIALFLTSALAFAASQAHAATDFTLGPSTLSVGTETDSTADGGCMNGTSNAGCDSYKFKVPMVVDPNGDISTDLQIPSDSIAIGISGSQFCEGASIPDLEVVIPHSSLIIKKTKGEVKISFNGMAAGFVSGGPAPMVPIKLLIQVNRHSGKGFLMASGIGDLSPMHGDSSAFVGLSTNLPDSDSDTDDVCTSVTQKNKNAK